MDIKTKAILVVDDAKMQRMMLQFCLNDAGYHNIQQAGNGQEALDIAKKLQFDLVITDINMPKMHGLALVEALRALPQYKETPILIVSTADSDATKLRAKEVGACAYITKPFLAPALHTAIEKLLIAGKCINS